MLYLIENENLYKIGYTANIKTRMGNYKTHNPECVLINTIEGSSNDEKQLHKLCEEYRYSKEWFYKNDNILELFNNYKTIEWNNWNEIKTTIDEFVNYIKNMIENFNTDCWQPKMKYETYSKLSTFFKNVETLTKPEDYEKYHKLWEMSKQFYLNDISKLEFIALLTINNIISKSEIKDITLNYYKELKLKLKKQINKCNIIISESQNIIYKTEAEKIDLEEKYESACEMYNKFIND